jgi:hypothetical protein
VDSFIASAHRSPARRASCSASSQAPRSCMISARCRRHVPVKLTMSGCCSHHVVSAAVHSWARRGSYAAWQPMITPQ